MQTRRDFLHRSILAGTAAIGLPHILNAQAENNIVMTVKGPIPPDRLGFTLSHEHIVVDFIGADKYSRDRYNADEVFAVALPFLQDVKKKGCVTFMDCTPAYLGRDVQLCKRFADATGLNIVTNTGYYGAVKEKYLPPHAYTESARQLADRWILEYTHGIDGTDVKPGFIKTSVDNAPLTPVQVKLIEAAALTHLATGLTIAVHTGNGNAAKEQLEILKAHGVAPTARIWVHAQNEPDTAFHVETARRKGWVAFDGVNPESMQAHLQFLQKMKKENLLDRVLVAQDSGWYNIGEPKGGNFKDYNCILTQFIPMLKQNGFTQAELDKFFIHNPAKAFTIGVRKI